MQKLNYVHEDPMAAGLVNFAEEYKYTSAKFYLEGIDEFDMITHYSSNWFFCSLFERYAGPLAVKPDGGKKFLNTRSIFHLRILLDAKTTDAVIRNFEKSLVRQQIGCLLYTSRCV